MPTIDEDFWDDLLGKEEEYFPPGLETIPILPSDYPLFSWDDWPESYNALVPGMPTKYFQKETWNAIVDTINNALFEAGIEWQDPRFHDRWEEVPYTIEDSKILRSYGQLTAGAFNTVCNNVDIGTPVHWAWKTDKNFRGYVGKSRFRGTTITYDDTGAIVDVRYGDHVYPEYIFELVRRVNLMLELMRGTKPTVATSASHNANSSIIHRGARSLRGARISHRYMLRSLISSFSLDEYFASDLYPRINSVTNTIYNMELTPAAGIWRRIPIKTLQQVSGKVYFKDQIQFFEPRHLAETNIRAGAISLDPSSTSARTKTWSYSNVLADKIPFVITSAQLDTHSKSVVSAEATQFRAREAYHEAYSKVQTDMSAHKKVLFDPRYVSLTNVMLSLSMSRPANVFMHTDFDFFISGLARDEWVKNILLWYDDLLLSRGNGTAEDVAQRLLYAADRWLYYGNVRKERPEAHVLYLSDWNLNTANRKIEKPEEIQLVFSDSDVFTANRTSQKFTLAYLNGLDHLLYLAAAIIEDPVESYLHLFDPRLSIATGQFEDIVENYLYGINYYVEHSGGKLERPERLYLRLVKFMLTLSSGRKQIPSRYYGRSTNRLIGNAWFQHPTPTEVQMYMLDFRLSTAYGALEEPTVHFAFSEQDVFGFTSAKPQNPILWHLFNLNRLIYSVYSNIETPTPHQAWWLESLLRCAGAHLQQPHNTLMQFLSAGVTSEVAPDIETPTEARLSAISTTVPRVDVDYQEATRILACSVVSDVFKAHADRRNLLAIYVITKGIAEFVSTGFVNPEMKEPTIISGITELPGVSGHVVASFLDIAFGAGVMTIPGIRGYASGALIDTVVTAGTAYLGHLYGIAGHNILRLRAGSGIARLPKLCGYGDAHTASTVASAGRTIELEFTCTFLCAYSLGRDFNVRMHIEIEPARGQLYGFVADTLPSAGCATLPPATGTLDYYLKSPDIVSLSSAAGYVQALNASAKTQSSKIVDATANLGDVRGCAGATTWSLTVQRGSTLYIRQTHEADLVDGVLTLY